jgi:hypothetical protein
MLATRLLALAAISFPAALAAGGHPAHCATLVYVPISHFNASHLASRNTFNTYSFEFQLTNRGRRRTKYSCMDRQYASRLSSLPRTSRCQRLGKFSSDFRANYLYGPSSVPFFTIVVGLRHGIDRDIPSLFFSLSPLFQAIL